jgi:hypothetical protein
MARYVQGGKTMNTYEARSKMSDLGHRAIAIVERLSDGSSASYEDRSSLREMAVESRELLVEAGFPGESVWRAVTRASLGVDTSLSASDGHFWNDLLLDLSVGTSTLDDLVSPHLTRDADFRIIG